ncbi:MAG: hypothetical protein EA360_05220 [Balneolaceae bacterium]|nr:MAG: hypothetical protein EA360_05220 [Balneolaceae bacterium]
MIKVLLTTFTLLFIFTGNVQAQTASTLEGDWQFSVNQAPWEYSRGVVAFVKDGDLWTGKILFHVNREVAIEEVAVEGAEIRFDVTVDGYDVRAVFTRDGDDLSGIVYTIEGNMPFRANRATEEE